MSVAMSTAVTGADFDTVAAKTRELLKDNGFGVLTEIDMQATLKAKLGEDMERYLILGACNPPLAHRAVTAEKRIGCCCRAMSWCARTRNSPRRCSSTR